jgi:hypothetical protein
VKHIVGSAISQTNPPKKPKNIAIKQCVRSLPPIDREKLPFLSIQISLLAIFMSSPGLLEPNESRLKRSVAAYQARDSSISLNIVRQQGGDLQHKFYSVK